MTAHQPVISMASRSSLRSSNTRVASSSTHSTKPLKGPSIALRPSTRTNKAVQPVESEPVIPKPDGKRSAKESIVKTRAAADTAAVTGSATTVSAVHTRRTAPASSSPDSQRKFIHTSLNSSGADKNTHNPRKRNFDALKSGSASSIPDGTRMRDGQAHKEPPNGQNAHETRSTRTTSSQVKLEEQTTTINDGTKPQDASNSEEARSLRSKAGGSRLKSDLATYFPNFDDVIAGVPPEPEYVKIDEPIHIIDEKLGEGRGKATNTILQSLSTQLKSTSTKSGPVVEPFNIYALAPTNIPDFSHDPLDSIYYHKSHQRAERREKQLRNIEKERAQHEKGQLEQLLDSLQGPDWLRAMGVTGITDGARKEWEPKRDYFVREVRALLDKFRVWREAEKRLLLHDREMALLAKEQEDDDEEDEGENDEGEEYESDAGAGASRDDEDSMMNGPSSSDVDAWAAHQLLREAKSAIHQKSRSRQKPSLQQRSVQNRSQAPRPLPKPSPPPKPFLSFFAKPHQREMALGKGAGSRQGTRRKDLILAFGHPIPAMEEQEFELPRDLLSADALIAHARKRRRLNRERKDKEKESIST